MTKSEFLVLLRKNLHFMPDQDRRKTVQYYSEMIDDRIEEGFSEEDAVKQIGSVYDLVSQIKVDYAECESIKETTPPSVKNKSEKSVNAWVVILLILGFPLWFSLLVAVFSVLVAVMASLWSVVIALWSVFVSFIACAFIGIVFGVGLNIVGKIFSGTALIGAGLVLAGLSIFSFYGCKAASKGAAFLTKQTVVFIKNCFVKRGAL